MFTGDGESSPPPPRRCWYPPQPRRCRRLALRGAGKGWGGPGRVLPGWGTPGGQGGGEEGRRVLEQLGADGRGEAPSFLRRPPPLPASTVDGAEGEGRAPTMGWLHFRVLMPILQANSVRLIPVYNKFLGDGDELGATLQEPLSTCFDLLNDKGDGSRLLRRPIR